MVQQLFSISRIASKRMLWLMGLMFAMILAFQCFHHLPYGISLSSGNISAIDQRGSDPAVNDRTSNTELVAESPVADSIKNSTAANDAMNQTLELGKDNDQQSYVSTLGYNVGHSGDTDIDIGSVAVPPAVAPISSSTNINVGKNKSAFEEKNNVLKVPSSGVYTISDMNNLWIQSYSSNIPIVPRWSSAADEELLQARLQIENAPVIDNDTNLYAPLFRNVSTFKRSYELMESTLKVYIYKEGEKQIFHQGPLQGIYASEGWFMKILESDKRFVTNNPKNAHLFYLPFSSRQLEDVLYVRDSHSFDNLIQHLKNYLDLIAAKYPHWNRTGGADHFLAACHDWAPIETRKHMGRCIRALCNSDMKEGFILGRDVSLPETYVRNARNPVKDVGNAPPSKRPILAFFAGSMHGELRSILVEYWERRKDPDMKISRRMPKDKGGKKYVWHMKNTKYCICAKGYEVNSPRVVESILYECVPVIVSDNFVPPLFEVLNWESFAVFVAEKDVPNLKNILLSIPHKRYREMHMRVKRLQPHFLWHKQPLKYDMFHMILHSIWYNRLYQITPK